MSKYQERQQALKKAQAVQRQQMTLIGVVIIVVVVFFGLFLFVLNRTGAGSAPGKYDQLYKTTTAEGFPILGDPTTKLTIIEFSDFGCPYCLGYKPTLNDIIDKYIRNGQARLVFSPQLFHQNSDVAAAAALCAQKQNKFWEMHDALFDIQSREGLSGFSIDRLKRSAEAIGADTNQWLECMTTNSTETKTTLTNAQNLFTKVHAEGTPTLMWSTDGRNWQFFLTATGQPYVQGGVPMELIARTIDNYYTKKT